MDMFRNFLRWQVIVRTLVVLVSAGTFLLYGNLIANHIIKSERDRQLSELAQLALRKSEAIISKSASALHDFIARGAIDCSSEPLQRVRFFIYRDSYIKDARIVRPDVTMLCAAFTETIEFDRGWVTGSDALPSEGDTTVRLFQVRQFMATPLGIVINIDDQISLAGIMPIDGTLLDVMPDSLRDYSMVSLSLTNGAVLSRQGSWSNLGRTSDTYDLTVESERFPIRTTIRVNKASMTNWNPAPFVPILISTGILGAIFGLLLSRNLFRPKSRLEEFDIALAQGQITPFFQPIFELDSGTITSAEVLARWVTPDGTIIPPVRFIDLAEENGRMPQMTWHLLATALKEMRQLMAVNTTFCLSINIAPSHFLAADFVSKLRTTVASANCAPERVMLEITEREEFPDLDAAAAIVEQLRGYGFKFAIDDVGIGHSGLSQIQRLRGDRLKIDKFFVDSVNHDVVSSSMIGMLVRLAEELDMDVVAEGIEDRTQVDALLACGIHKGQGYLVSPPVAARHFIQLVAKHNAGPTQELATARAA